MAVRLPPGQQKEGAGEVPHTGQTPGRAGPGSGPACRPLSRGDGQPNVQSLKGCIYIPITVVWFVTAWPRGLMYLCPWELKVIYLCPWEVNDISVSVGGQVSLPLIADILIYSVRSSIDAIQHRNY